MVKDILLNVSATIVHFVGGWKIAWTASTNLVIESKKVIFAVIVTWCRSCDFEPLHESEKDRGVFILSRISLS